jgi:hypothetical protein
VGDYVEFTIKDTDFDRTDVDCTITNRGIIVELTPEHLEILMSVKTAIVHSENEFFDKHHLSNNGDDALSGYRYIHLFDTYDTTAWGDLFSVSIHINSTTKLDFDIKVLSHDNTTVDPIDGEVTDYYSFK